MKKYYKIWAISLVMLLTMNSGLFCAVNDENSAERRISMDFRDASLKDVLKVFSQQSGLNFVADTSVEDLTTTLYLEGVLVSDALNSIIKANSLQYEQEEGSSIFVVKEVLDEEDISTITNVYYLKYARVSGSPIDLGTQKALLDVITEETVTAQEDEGSITAVRRSSVKDRGIDLVIEDLLTDRGSLISNFRTNSLIITDVPERFPVIESVIEQLDVLTKQIMIEAEIIETSLNALDRLGLKFGGGTDGVQFGSWTGPAMRHNWPFMQLSEGFDVASSSSTVALLDATTLAVTLEFLKTQIETKILARPKILSLDNESAIFRITADTAVGIDTTTGETSGLSTTSAERFETGISLRVTPQINSDNYITMFIEPSVTTTTDSSIQISGQTLKDPTTRSVKTVARVRDGETIVIGGLINAEVTNREYKVPILGDIPLVGRLFRNKNNDDFKKELLVFITPHIIKEEESVVTLADSKELAQLYSWSAPQEYVGNRDDEMERILDGFGK